MSSLIGRISKFARSPQGRKIAGEAARLARDPATRKKVTDAAARLRSRGTKPPTRGGGGNGAA